MSRELDSRLPRQLVQELTRTTPNLNAVLLISTDPRGFPHVSLLSYSELIFEEAILHFFLTNSSRSVKYLEVSGRCTLFFVRRNFVYYVKARVNKVVEFSAQSVFRVEVVKVLEDSPLPEEKEVFLKTGIRFFATDKELRRQSKLKEEITKRIQSGLTG